MRKNVNNDLCLKEWAWLLTELNLADRPCLEFEEMLFGNTLNIVKTKLGCIM